jgi:hypothetical protein
MTLELALVLMFLAAALAVMVWEWHAAGPPRCSRPTKVLHYRQ